MADRIEREIEEILKKIDKLPDKGKRPPARKPAAGPPRARGQAPKWLSNLSMRKVMMWALLAVVVAFFLRGIGPAGYMLLIGAIIVFVTAFILSTRSGGGASGPEKRWRGQPLDLSEPGWPDKIKSWWKGRKRR